MIPGSVYLGRKLRQRAGWQQGGHATLGGREAVAPSRSRPRLRRIRNEHIDQVGAVANAYFVEGSVDRCVPVPESAEAYVSVWVSSVRTQTEVGEMSPYDVETLRVVNGTIVKHREEQTDLAEWVKISPRCWVRKLRDWSSVSGE